MLFCLLLSFLLSINARDDQRSLVFSGVFATVWIAEAIVTLQIKLLGGNMCVPGHLRSLATKLTTQSQLLLPIRLHHRLHALPARHRIATQCAARADHCPHSRLQCARTVVPRSGSQHSGRQRRGQEPGLAGRVPALRLLRRPGLPLLHFVAASHSSCIIDYHNYHRPCEHFSHKRRYANALLALT